MPRVFVPPTLLGYCQVFAGRSRRPAALKCGTSSAWRRRSILKSTLRWRLFRWPMDALSTRHMHIWQETKQAHVCGDFHTVHEAPAKSPLDSHASQHRD